MDTLCQRECFPFCVNYFDYESNCTLGSTSAVVHITINKTVLSFISRTTPHRCKYSRTSFGISCDDATKGFGKVTFIINKNSVLNYFVSGMFE